MRSFTTSCLLVAVVLISSVGAASAGKYQRTLDKKAHIWNDDPKPWEEANWSGGRDRLNLADGPGTLVWYHAERGPVERTKFSAEKLHFASKLTGTMLRGRWEGVVEAMDAAGHTTHAVFDNGKLMEPWSEGPATAQAKVSGTPKATDASRPPPPEVVTSTPAAVKPAAEKPATEKLAAAKPPAEKAAAKSAPMVMTAPPPESSKVVTKSSVDLPSASPNIPSEFSVEPRPLVQNTPSRSSVPTTAALGLSRPPLPTNASTVSSTRTSSSAIGSGSGSMLNEPLLPPPRSTSAGDLFQSLAAPPALLQHRATLAPKEVTKIAEVELARKGYKLSDYPRRQLTYNPDSDSWYVSYEHGSGNESAPGPTRFAVSVDDKSGKASTSP